MKSMTGFGRALHQDQGMSCESTVRTLNHRYKQIKLKVSSELYEMEPFIRDIINDRISRGTVDVNIKLDYPLSDLSRLQLDYTLAREYVYHLRKLSSKVDIPGVDLDHKIRLDSLLQLDSIWSLQTPNFPEEELKRLVSASLQKAFDEVDEVRETEGQKLKSIITEQLDGFKKVLPEVVALAEQQSIVITERCQKKLSEKLSDISVDEKRLLEEVHYFCERADITEELDRIQVHLDSAFEILDSDSPIGRRFEFLIQELFREVNTLGVKATLADISTRVIELKTQLDKLKEQLQNIE